MIYIEVDDEGEGNKETPPKEARDDSSSDENDSTAAAHAAAIGHSPQPFKPTVATPTDGAEKPAETDTKEEGECESSIHSEVEDMKEKPKVEPAQHEAPVNGNGHAAASVENAPIPMVVDQEARKEASDPAAKDSQNNGIEGESQVDVKVEKKKKLEVDPDVSLNERDEDENTSLHVAILARKLEHVKILLEAGASFRLRSDGSWPIHTAISTGAIASHRQFAYECVVALHEAGADLTVKCDSVHTPLYLACMFNLPQIASYIISHAEGLSTLNTRADRAGNRPLHAAAKYDTLDNASLSKTAVASATGQLRTAQHHHPDGTVVNAMHAIPGFPGKLDQAHVAAQTAPVASSPAASGSREAATDSLMTQVLLGATGVEIDALNMMGRTPLHVACARGNWAVARLLMQGGASTTIADRRGFSPGQLAYKRGMPIPIDVLDALGDPPESGTIPPLRDLIVDPDGTTLLLSHELCMLHRTCAPIRRNSPDPPPENVRRLHVLIDKDSGILRNGEFSSLTWKGEARRAAISDILKVHFVAASWPEFFSKTPFLTVLIFLVDIRFTTTHT